MFGLTRKNANQVNSTRADPTLLYLQPTYFFKLEKSKLYLKSKRYKNLNSILRSKYFALILIVMEA